MSLLLLLNQPASATTYLSDTFTGTNGASWNSSNWTMQGGTQTIQGNRGEMLTPGGYGNSIIDVVPTIPANFSFTGQVQFASANSTFAIEYRNNGTDYYRAFVTPTELVVYSTPWSTIVAFASISTSLTDLVNFRLEVDGTSHKMRFWLNSDPEPSTWNINATNSVTTATPTVPMRLFYGDPNSVTGYLDNVSVTSVGGVTTVSRSAVGSGTGAASALWSRTSARSATGSSTSNATTTTLRTILRSATGSGTGSGTASPSSNIIARSATGSSTSNAITTSLRTIPRSATGSGSSTQTAARLCTRVRSATGFGSSGATASRLRTTLRSATGVSAATASALCFKSAFRTASALGSSSSVATPGLLIITTVGHGDVIVWSTPTTARWREPSPSAWSAPSPVTDSVG